MSQIANFLFFSVSLDGRTANCELADAPTFPAAMTYKDGSVLACGGYLHSDSDRCWRFDGSAWMSMPQQDHHHCFVNSPNLLVDQGWWVAGSNTNDNGAHCSGERISEIFTGEEWVPGPAHPKNGSTLFSCLVRLNSTQSMFIGGHVSSRQAWIYDWSSGQWTETGSLNKDRRWHGCVSLGDNLGALVVGGRRDGEAIYSVELYDPVEGGWSTQPDVPRDVKPVSPVLLNHAGQVLALFQARVGQPSPFWEGPVYEPLDRVYQWSRQTGEWSVLEGVHLPAQQTLISAVLVPDDFAPSCL